MVNLYIKKDSKSKDFVSSKNSSFYGFSKSINLYRCLSISKFKQGSSIFGLQDIAMQYYDLGTFNIACGVGWVNLNPITMDFSSAWIRNWFADWKLGNVTDLFIQAFKIFC